MEELSKTQLILLVLLVSFITSLTTGIITVTLLEQTPVSVQTLNRVIEKTIEKRIVAESQPASSAAPLVLNEEDLVVKAVKKASPAVVSVIRSEGGSTTFGSGFFVSSDGIILTSRHLVEGEESRYFITTKDGKKFKAEVLFRAPYQDFALLKVEAEEEGENFNSLNLGDSDSLKIGQSVIAVGGLSNNPQSALSVGVVSGLTGSVSSFIAGEEKAIWSDVRINAKNSGGPLLDLKGRAVGIIAAFPNKAGGFAIPINEVKRDIQDIAEFGKVKLPYLGLKYAPVEIEREADSAKDKKEPEKLYGWKVVEIAEGSPADKAGIKSEDVILKLGGIQVGKGFILDRLLRRFRVGDKLAAEVMRKGKKLELEIILEEIPSSEPESS